MDIETILNIAISLVFLYLLLSLMTSAFEELVAGAWNTRGQGLRKAIGQMLGDPELKGLAKSFYAHPLIDGLVRTGWDIRWLSWLHPLFPMLRARQPSYIEPAMFADTLLDILRRSNSLVTGNMQAALAALWSNAKQDETIFRTSLIDWYKASTDRQSGLYKRNAQRWLFLYGFVLAALLNIDTLQVARYLWDGGNATRSAEIAAQAADYLKKNPNLPASDPANAEQKFGDLLKAVQDLKLPMGWNSSSPCAIAKGALQDVAALPVVGWLVKLPGGVFCESGNKPALRLIYVPSASPPDQPKLNHGPVTAEAWFGWIITALAISLGAQFWFDTLGKVVGLRASGRRPGATEPTEPAPPR